MSAGRRSAFTDAELRYLRDAPRSRLARIATVGEDGTPHVVPVGVTLDVDTRLARVICSRGSVKARNAARDGSRAALCQVDGGRWLTLSGPIEVLTDPEAVADAERVYAQRYRTPKVNPTRVVLRMDVAKIMGRVPEPLG